MTVCWSCEKVKGKRVCPARGGALICSKCCGTKRGVEIQCPKDCPYLHGADPNWHSDTQQKEHARFLSRFFSLNEGQAIFVLFFHHLLFSARARWRGFTDEQISEVIASSRKTLETRSKGIVYNHPASSPHIDAQVDWLVRMLTERSQFPSAPEASDDDVIAVLQAVGDAMSDHSRGPSAGTPYLDVAEEVFRASLEQAPEIKLPGEPDEPPTDLIVPP